MQMDRCMCFISCSFVNARSGRIQVSPALDLVKDYSRFVIEFFEVINISAPHIYHSALLLSPLMSIVRGLYKQYVRPFTRVVRGLPVSWEPISATLRIENFNGGAVWSPCGRFIAVAKSGSTEILDAVTLNPLSTLEPPPGLECRSPYLSFTPDGRFLTRFSFWGIVSWDIQTGGPLGIGTVQSGFRSYSQYPSSFTYSIDGKMVAVAYGLPPDRSCSVVIFDLFGARMHTHLIQRPIIPPIWTHGQCLRFVTMKQSSITIWEVAFTSTLGPAEVESLPAPAKIADWRCPLFFPALSRLAFILRDTVQIWDAKASKLLLKTGTSRDPRSVLVPVSQCQPHPLPGSFSSDGHFFARTVRTGVRIWKESPSGYILHQKLAFNSPRMAPHLSPDGESIIIPLRSAIQLWSTKDQILSSPDTPAGDHDFVLGFSPNELFAGFARSGGNMVKILDLRSGDLLLATDMHVRFWNLWMTENTVVVVSGRGIVSWNLPGENSTFKSWFKSWIKGSVRTTALDHPVPSSYRFHSKGFGSSISPDPSRVVVTACTDPADVMRRYLGVYDVSTGRYLGSIKTSQEPSPVFTLDGHQIWDMWDNFGWEIVEGSGSGTVELKPLDRTARRPGLFPFHSPHGYEVTEDGWVLSPARERLLWLPQRWRSGWTRRTWGGRFLALLHCELSDVVILEFFE